jgi:hypothetical protein
MHLTCQTTPNLILLENRPSPLTGGQWFAADDVREGFIYRIKPGSLANIRWLTADFIAPGNINLAFYLEFYEPNNLAPCCCGINILPQVQARFRFDLDALNMNRWRYQREGALLKPLIEGSRIDPLKVDMIKFILRYKTRDRIEWCMTPLRSSVEPSPVLTTAILLNGPLLDPLGQFALKNWPGKTINEQELTSRLHEQSAVAAAGKSFPGYSRWGGWSDQRIEASGFFRTHHDGSRWWLVDPDGCLFWSTGPDCVRPVVQSNIKYLHNALTWLPNGDKAFADAFAGPREGSSDEAESFDYLVANFIRVFGKDWHRQWEHIIFPLLSSLGFNTVGNWSDCSSAAKAAMPYVIPMKQLTREQWKVSRVFRDFPDVFDLMYYEEASLFAAQLQPLVQDPALIGYFLMNEPEWGFTSMTIAEGMLRNTADCATRRALADKLRRCYVNDENLSRAWQMPVSFNELEYGLWNRQFTANALADLEQFSTIMAQKLYDTLSAACHKIDPNHLNLGARFASVPDGNWLLDAMGSFDVFSINCYRKEADDRLAPICERLKAPALIGEWHFGSLDVGLPAPALMHNPNQQERANAFRYYLERTAAKQWCVGAHWFTLYDQSAIGRFDGENYNVGFLDVCHRPYAKIGAAARQAHTRLYRIAAGELAPYDLPPTYSERLNM